MLAAAPPPSPPPKPHPTTSTHPQSRDSLEPGRGEGFCWGERGGEAGEKGKWVERVSGKGWGGGVSLEGRGCGGVWKILPISMWRQKGSDRRSNPVKIDMVT